MKDRYQEGKSNAFASLYSMEIFAIGIPAILAVGHKKGIRYFVTACVIFSSQVGFLLLLLVPKVRYQRKGLPEGINVAQSILKGHKSKLFSFQPSQHTRVTTYATSAATVSRQSIQIESQPKDQSTLQNKKEAMTETFPDSLDSAIVEPKRTSTVRFDVSALKIDVFDTLSEPEEEGDHSADKIHSQNTPALTSEKLSPIEKTDVGTLSDLNIEDEGAHSSSLLVGSASPNAATSKRRMSLIETGVVRRRSLAEAILNLTRFQIEDPDDNGQNDKVDLKPQNFDETCSNNAKTQSSTNITGIRRHSVAEALLVLENIRIEDPDEEEKEFDDQNDNNA